MNGIDRVAVCSRSFSKNKTLRRELLQRYQQVTFNDKGGRLQGETLVKFLKGHTKAIVGLERLDRGVLAELPELSAVSKYGVGLDMIDLEAMRDLGKKLSWVGGVNRRAVSELVLGMIISSLRYIPLCSKEVISGTWQQRGGRQLTGKIVGIVGCGAIGKDLVQLLKPFRCRILVNDIQAYRDFYSAHNLEPTDLESLLSESDIVTLHVPLDESTTNMLSAERLQMMKREAVLINTARGGVVDEVALKAELKSGRLSSAAFDVFHIEPPEDQGLIELNNFLATPHIGGSTEEAILAMGRVAIAGLDK